MIKQWLIFDVDDVLCDFVPTVYEIGGKYNLLSTDIHHSQWDSYNHLNYFKHNDADKFREFLVEANVLEQCKATKGAKHFMQWAKDNYELGFITARGYHPHAQRVTEEFLEKELGVDGKVIVSGLYGSNKSQYANDFEGSIIAYIDDNPSHVREFSKLGINSVLMTQFWNNQENDILRVKNFDEYKAFINNYC
jgi:hypothetical protein